MPLITTAEAADKLGVKPRTIQRRVKAGVLTPARTLHVGGRNGIYLFDRDAIDALAADVRPRAS